MFDSTLTKMFCRTAANNNSNRPKLKYANKWLKLFLTPGLTTKIAEFTDYDCVHVTKAIQMLVCSASLV